VAHIEMDDKRFFLEEIIKSHAESKILVFVRTKVRAERVKNAMDRVDLKTETIHGDKDQSERDRIMHNFRTGETLVLIATDLSARGIDIPNVEYVVNYDLPEITENYVHRVGRTGRANKRGQALSFCSAEEKELLAEIEELLGKPIKQLAISKDDYKHTLEVSNENVNDWQALIDEEENRKGEKKRKKM
jgi:ATP-dependent RNA helicase RhlE